MIRDPSDGSVKEITGGESQEKVVSAGKPPVQTSPVVETTTSGLQTGSTKPENLARLQRSREWLADYHAGKIKPKFEEQP
jgi:hypothetical protein